jgi:hypothetical protein
LSQVRSGSSEYTICIEAFCAFYDVSASSVECLANYVVENIVPPAYCEVKLTNQVSKELIHQIDSCIEMFPWQASNCSHTESGKLLSIIRLVRKSIIYASKYV